jgi:hypothetical protein
MRFLLGWAFKLGFLGAAYLVVSGKLPLKLPDSVLGYEMPPLAKQWAERVSQVNDLENSGGNVLRQISDRLR